MKQSKAIDKQSGSNLPGWVLDVDEGNRDQVAYTNRILKALSIAWGVLQEIDPPLNSTEHGCWKIARDALRRIEELGK